MKNSIFILSTILILGSCVKNSEQEKEMQGKKESNVILNSSFKLKGGAEYFPYVDRNFPTNVYFGDTHLHTSISLDAFGDGNTKIGPDEAYQWAKGEVISGDDGAPTRISRPLDFLMVADHAEYMGLVPGLARKDKELMSNPEGARWAKMIEEGKLATHVFSEFIYDITQNTPRLVEPKFEMSVWNSIIDAAQNNNEPGKFTAFIGYEYSPFPNGNNLHRVVVFKDGKEKTSQIKPFLSLDSENPEDFWDYLQGYEDKTRMRWEPIYEVTQYKGDVETHPYLSPNDEFADFETWDKGNLAMLESHKDEYYQTEYARSALKLGLKQGEKLGENPFKFGMIGATDSHTGRPQASEDNFLGKYGSSSPSANRWKKEWPPVDGTVAKMYGWESQSAGYAAVWATENTREALWEAMKRKEVYATTGPRMRVRMFGGFEFNEKDAFRSDLPAIGYAVGVPMGGDLNRAPVGKHPVFLLSAVKDPDGANLDRIQIIKGWQNADGELEEKVYDVI